MQRYTAFATAVFTISLSSAPLLAADPFTLVVVPDTQNYADYTNINNQYNVGQMNWIANNMTSQNIKFVMHLGDFQNPGNPYRARTDNIYEPDYSKPIGNAAAVQEKIDDWNRADTAIKVLDNNHVPYSLVPGNHDYRNNSTKDEPWLYLKTFGPSRYVSTGSTTYKGASPVNPNNGYAGMNTYHQFDAGGYTFMNIALQFDPDNDDLAWAQKIINQYPGLPTVITTHAYVNTKPAASDYQHPDIFNKLVKNNPQIVMTFNGHLTGANYVAGTNIAGETVHQMLYDAQSSQLDTQLGGDYYRGGGVLRLVQVDANAGHVNIKDYSPIANKYLPSNFTAPDNNGVNATYSTPAGFDIDFKGRFGLADHAGIIKTASLRDGVNGYDATTDTYIDATDINKNNSAAKSAWVDDNVSGGLPQEGLIRFDLFGAGNITRGSVIESATLTLHTTTATNAQTNNAIAIYRLLKTFDDTKSWSDYGGFSTDGVEALLAESGSAPSAAQGEFITFDVTEAISTWSDGATNHGWVIKALGGNGWNYDTAESDTIAFRPQLDVSYRVVPEPASSLMLLLAAPALMLRRRVRAS